MKIYLRKVTDFGTLNYHMNQDNDPISMPFLEKNTHDQ